LVVEGTHDKWAVQSLISKHVVWPNSREESDWPVNIETPPGTGGYTGVIKKGYLSSRIKNYDTVGVIMDADDIVQGRYESLLAICHPFFPNLPKNPGKNGTIASNPEGKRLGIWLMPDNESDGNLEIFLKFLVPESQKPVWDFAVKSFSDARALGATCKEPDFNKANLYTYLAWHDAPGQSVRQALTCKVLDAQSQHAQKLISWFKELYSLP